MLRILTTILATSVAYAQYQPNWASLDTRPNVCKLTTLWLVGVK